MATRFRFRFRFISLLQSAIVITAAAAAAAATAPYLSPEQRAAPPYNLSSLLDALGFHGISVAATSSSAAAAANETTTTIFSPTDVSLRSCPYCSLPLLLLEHSVPGLYPFRLLATFTVGTKIQTLASTTSTRLCLTLTKSTPQNSTTDPKLFVGGVEVTRPDLFNDGNVIIHGIQGYVAHLSPFSCQIERMTSLSFPSTAAAAVAPPPLPATRGMLKEVMYHLRLREYTVLALLIQENLDLLSRLNRMTIFAVDDAGVFGDGNAFVSSLKFHVVPNVRLTALELITLRAGSVLPTMVAGESLVVTVAGGGGPLSPMRINNVRITGTNIVVNKCVVVHGIGAPLPRVHRTAVGYWPDQTEGGSIVSSGRH
ncbi:hypothetical protein SSX86_003480 [Deinandra increscens subsp. villosa]|uniref:FAS1 domain-containing protein n=1 Tax=Deinandra increscens subsp. villosa TaxID=3103831 RepID=A0AAP0DHB7_9ASTR